jgi:hypothetical protein
MNNCRFCWQRLFNDKSTWLNESEKIDSVKLCSKKVDEEAKDCDILLVGGEIFSDQGEKVNAELERVYNQIAQKIKDGNVRFLYANTNLCYAKRDNMINLLEAFKGLEDRLKFTTSYDLDGRFNRLNENEQIDLKSKGKCNVLEREKLFLDNLKFIADNYPDVNVVANTIITKAVADAVINEGYDTHWLVDAYPNTVVDVNLIPYIPIKGDYGLDVKFSHSIKVLEAANKKHPGYFFRYISSLDANQEKLLYEYHKDVGFIERTADTLPCGHNENFKLVNRADDCFLCKVDEYYRDNQDRLGM